MSVFTVACLQNTAERDTGPTLETLGDMVRRARDMGAEFIAAPEVCSYLEPRRRLVLEKAEPQENHRGLDAFREWARETGAWLLAGSMVTRTEEERLANRSYLLDPAGEIAATYDKIHMFDVDIGEGDRYRESRTYRPGESAVTVSTPLAVLGLTICYDMRFPALYRALAQAGAEVITVPSAFTVPTGRAHWHVLLRARAIETGCFIVAPAQVGEHAEGRRTYGHSLIVAPWGEVLADGGEEPGDKIHMFDVDIGEGDRYRESRTYRPGESAVTVSTPLAVLGLTICYDMRFPALYRALAQAGAEVITVPSAFTVPTGRAHWHVLLRARAIETGCFIVAPAQVGEHAEGRRTYGHSLIVAPWGEVLADGGEEPGIVTAEIDTARVAEARARVPSLSGDRPFDLPLAWREAAE